MKNYIGLVTFIEKLIRILRTEGFLGLCFRLSLTNRFLFGYKRWIAQYDTLNDETKSVLLENLGLLNHQPLISILMPTYNSNPQWLIEAIESVRKQIYPNWELCIADDASTNKSVREVLNKYINKDPRIKVVFRENNGHISEASNSCISIAKGEWITFLDHDDVLPEHSLFYIVNYINKYPSSKMIYSDEDKMDANGSRCQPHFKPDWNPDLFLSHNYLCHLTAYKKKNVEQVGGFRAGYEGAQDYDLALRIVKFLRHDEITHIPQILYHWRIHKESTALDGSAKNYSELAAVRALDDYLISRKIKGKSESTGFGAYRIHYEIPTKEPLVSLIIPTRNGLNLLKQCIESIRSKTTYVNYEILVIDNGSDDPEVLNYLLEIDQLENIKVIGDDRPFNYSQLNNTAVKYANGEYIGLINNDIEVINEGWLNEMLSLAIQPGVGAVGARLWYSNNTLQHGGVVVGLGGVAGHSHKYLPKNSPGYCNRAQLIQNFSAVTAACMIVSKKIYEEVGGLDEVNLTVAFNDVDFCLKVLQKGYRNVWTPYAELYHHESASRGIEDSPEKIERFNKEINHMQTKWGTSLVNDPAYNPNLTLDREDFSLAWPPRESK